MTRRAWTVALLTVAFALVGGPALADPPGPTHFRSTITEVVGADGGEVPVDVTVIGGDGYLVVEAPPGTTVEVPGYEGEPYLRFAADGTVEVNERSPARWLNAARFGEAETEVPPLADPEAPPTWVLVARDGHYAWHDHRIHFMSPSLPTPVDPTLDEVQEVFTWSVPLLVDGQDVEVRGQLAWVPGPSPVPSLLGLVVLAVAAGLLAVRRPAAVGAVAAGGALVAGAVGAAMQLPLPTGADTDPAMLVLPGMAIGLVVLGRALGRGGQAAASLLVPAAGLPLVVWGVLQLGTLTRPILPGPLPPWGLRFVVLVVLAAGVGGLVALAREVAIRTRLDDGLGEVDDAGAASVG